jgi:hypothetical protein
MESQEWMKRVKDNYGYRIQKAVSLATLYKQQNNFFLKP